MGIFDFIFAAAVFSRAKKQKYNGIQNNVAHDPYENGWHDAGDDCCEEYDDAEDYLDDDVECDVQEDYIDDIDDDPC